MLTIINSLVLATLNSVAMGDSIPLNSTDTLHDINRDLDALVVVAKKDIIKSDGAKLTYDVTQDQSAKGNTLLDALRKVPMVTVDGNDNIYINGNSNFKIYVNGKADPMFTANYQKIFKAMPASSVSKIEVITEPGAKYDAEGVGGVLNLVIEQKQKREGYSGNVSASLSNRQYYLNGYVTSKYKNIAFDVSATYMHSLSPQSSISNNNVVDYTGSDVYRKVTDTKQKFGFGYGSANVNLSWEPDDNNLFTFGATFNSMGGKAKEFESNQYNYSKTDELLSSLNKKYTGTMKDLGVSANASYQHNFAKRGHNLVLSYLYNFGKNPFHMFNDNTEISYIDNQMASDVADIDNTPRYYFMGNLMNNYIREHTGQLDYSLPFGRDDNQLFESGAKLIFRHNSTYSFTQYGKNAETAVDVPSATTEMNQNQNVSAVYATYSGTFGKINASGGIRYEHTDMGMENLLKPADKFWRSLNDIVPNAAISYIFSASSNLRLAYQMRISRPSLSQLSPYQFSFTEDMIQEGNPELSSEKSNSISLKYSNFTQKIGGNIGIEYSQTDNAISDFTTWENGRQYYSYANIGSRKRVSLNGFLMLNMSAKMTINLSGSVSYEDLNAKSLNRKNSGWSGNYNINWNYTMPGDIKWYAYGGQAVHMINLQGYWSGWYYYGIGVARDFLKDKKLNVSVNAANFLTKYNHFTQVVETSDFKRIAKTKNRNMNLSLTVSWKFGNSNMQRKKVSKSIQNDDESKSDNSGKGGGMGGL